MPLEMNRTRNVFYFFPKLNKYKGNIKIVLTYSNTWLEISGLSSTKNELSCVSENIKGRELPYAGNPASARNFKV